MRFYQVRVEGRYEPAQPRGFREAPNVGDIVRIADGDFGVVSGFEQAGDAVMMVVTPRRLAR